MPHALSAALEEIKKELAEIKANPPKGQAFEQTKARILGRKGKIRGLYNLLKDTPAAERPVYGQKINEIKALAESIFLQVQESGRDEKEAGFDWTLPAYYLRKIPFGKRHILTQTIDEIVGIFKGLGFELLSGPEIETEFNNFTALNIDITHPSRDAFDTFYLSEDCGGQGFLLRSHTSPMQARVMKQYKPPLAAVIPGRVYRPDAVDASHSFMFHQIEGFYVDDDVRFSHLKGVLLEFARAYFSPDTQIRLRPHYFPFTEPSAEVDVSCLFCKGQGCSVCKSSGWVEVLGCGMIHPNVFEAVGGAYVGKTGFAFGMGIERLCMLKYGIPDIRLFYTNDYRFLSQF